MSVGPDPNVDVNTIEHTRRQIQRLFDEVARLSELDLSPNDYFGEYLNRVLRALAAPAGAVWMRTPQGNLQLQYQVNLQQIGLNRTEEARQAHDELLRVAFQQPRPLDLPPQSFAGKPENGNPAPGNPTNYILLLVPIQVENRVDGLLEVWQNPDRNPAAIKGFLQFMTEICQLASRFLRNRLMRQMAGQQALWTQLEAFTRQIHKSLNPVETAYVIANEGRRIIDCDRLSVAVRYARRCTVEAVSGADVVERRSNLVQLMRTLFDKVLAWGEKLVYTGTKDEGLPPQVHQALDAYLAESNSKLLVVMPLVEESEKESKKTPRSALLMECFEPAVSPEQLIARLDMIGKHAVSSLYNGVQYRRIPFRFLWLPLAKVQEGLGGKARAITLLVVVALVALMGVLCFVPYPLKVEAKGSLLPEERALIFSPGKGYVEPPLPIKPGDEIKPRQDLVMIYDQDLAEKIQQLQSEIRAADLQVNALAGQRSERSMTQQERNDLDLQKITPEETLRFKKILLDNLLERNNALKDRPGFLWVKAPKFADVRPTREGEGGNPDDQDPVWTILTPDFQETLPRRPVEPKDPLLRLGNKSGRWEVEMKIPQKHIGQVLQAYQYLNTDTLDVDLIVKSESTRTYKGKLERSRIAGEATPHRDEIEEAEPVVLAWVRIEGNDIPQGKRIPRELMLTGVEVHAKVRCGNHAMGYSLFYGVWEFFYEKIVFFF